MTQGDWDRLNLKQREVQEAQRLKAQEVPEYLRTHDREEAMLLASVEAANRSNEVLDLVTAPQEEGRLMALLELVGTVPTLVAEMREEIAAGRKEITLLRQELARLREEVATISADQKGIAEATSILRLRLRPS
jgi:Flp pilus assembly CpaE family ATPase